MILNLPRTGDFWIDLGLVQLRKYILYQHNPNITLSNNRVIAKISRNDLYEDKDTDSQHLGTVTLSNNNLILDFNEETFNELLASIIESIKSPYLGLAKTGRLWWQRIGRFFFSNQKPSVFFELPSLISSKQKSKWKNGICAFCSLDNRAIKPAGSTEHPLVVVPGKFSSFYSNLRGEIMICNWCAFASKFSPLGLLYNVSGDSITAISFESDNLIDLSTTLNSFSKLFIQSEWYRNFPSVLKYTKYPLEGFLDFMFSTINEIDKKQDEEGRNILKSGKISKVHIIQATHGQGLSIDKYFVIPNMPKVFEFILHCNWIGKNQKSFNCLSETARSLITKRGKDMETIQRDEFARKIFYNKDIGRLMEEFLISKISSNPDLSIFTIINIDKFIFLYYISQIGMDRSQLDTSKQIGNFIGELAFSEDNKSLIYSLRTIGNLDSLLAYFNQLLVRYIDYEKADPNIKSLLYSIDKTNWFVYKSLIGIFSVLTYKRLKREKSQKFPLVSI